MQNNQTSLAGEGRDQRKAVCDETGKLFGKMFRKEELTLEDWDVMEKFSVVLSEDVQTQRRRIGGDWAVAGCLPYRRMRDMIRANLGPELVIVSLVMDEEDIMERLSSRHLDQESVVEGLMVVYMCIFMILYLFNS